MSEQSLPLDETVLFDPAAPGAIEMAAELIANGGVVAIPTDTVYGIAASLSHPAALRRIMEIKHRDPAKSLPILVSSTDALARLIPDIDPRLPCCWMNTGRNQPSEGIGRRNENGERFCGISMLDLHDAAQCSRVRKRRGDAVDGVRGDRDHAAVGDQLRSHFDRAGGSRIEQNSLVERQ